MLKLPAVVTHEIDGFLPAADALKRGLASKESPEPIATVGQPLGDEMIIMGSGTTRKTPWAQVSGKIAV